MKKMANIDRHKLPKYIEKKIARKHYVAIYTLISYPFAKMP